MADAPITLTMTQENVALAFAATLYLSTTERHVEERKAAQAANRWTLSALEGIPPLGGFELPENEKAAIANALEGVRFEDPNLDEARQWIIKALRRESTKPPKPKPPEPGQPIVALEPLPMSTDFLAAGRRTHPYAGYNDHDRERVRNEQTERGYRHCWVYAYNEKDYGGPSFDYLRKPQEFRPFLEELRKVGLAPIVWLFPDDAPTIHNTGTSVLQGLISSFVPAVDDLVCGYVLGLELDEYWDSGKVNTLGNTLRGVTTKKLGCHMTPGKWDFARQGWADYMILQYGFDKSASFIASMTKTCIGALGGKPVVAGEYALDDENKGKPLGDAAVAAGAAGFGNGGTPPAPIIPVEPPGEVQAISSPNLLVASFPPWRPGSLTAIADGYKDSLTAYAGKLQPTTQLVLADMDAIPDAMRAAGFSGRNNALWYCLSRSYAGWNWTFNPADPDAHLSGQRSELQDFWEHYLDVVLQVMRQHSQVTALFLLNDGHDKCGDVLSDYSLRQLAPVASRIDRGTVYHGRAATMLAEGDPTEPPPAAEGRTP